MSQIVSQPFGSYQQQYQLEQLLGNWKLTPATFAHKISRGTWIPAPHLMYVSKKIATGIARGGARIIISLPPRHGKSELTSVYTPAWVLENFPQLSTLLIGYGQELTIGFSRRVRDMFLNEENHHLLSTRIRDDVCRAEAFQTTEGGGVYSVGIGGAITGRGAHVLLIDDYIKEIKEALSPTQRQYLWDWFSTTAFTRLEPGGSCIILATRWHSDDLIGRIVKEFPGEWDYIELPAIALENDLLGRAVGEPLFPARYDLPVLEERKKVLGSIFFQALFQQKPVDQTNKVASGDWLQVIDPLPYYKLASMRQMRMWDLAATEGGGDYIAGTKVYWDRLTGNVYIAHVARDQLSPMGVEALVKGIAVVDGTECKIGIEQEPGSAGKILCHQYATNVLPEYMVEAMPTVVNKLVRAQPLLAAAEAGKVFLFKGDWNEDFIKEFDTFPTGDHDDQVDTAAAAYAKLSGKRAYSAAWGRKKPETVDGDNSGIGGGSKGSVIMVGNSAIPQRRSRVTFGR